MVIVKIKAGSWLHSRHLIDVCDQPCFFKKNDESLELNLNIQFIPGRYCQSGKCQNISTTFTASFEATDNLNK